MPSKPPTDFTKMAVSSWSKLGPKKAAIASMSQLGLQNAHGLKTLNVDLEDGSKMVAKKQSPKEVTDTERINLAMEAAIQGAIHAINRKIIYFVILEKVRNEINQKFHNILGPKDIDSFAREAARSASYGLQNLESIPEDLMPNSLVDLATKDSKNTHTEEPDGEFSQSE